MSTYVARTCTEVGLADSAEASQPISTFRDRDAYVLLGDPGSGKTTEFKEEAERLGEAAEYLSARKFIRDPLEAHPEWLGKTLFVDGLDERRAGTTDLRTPVDQIIGKLGLLKRPKFRISCREADWLGLNDRQNLEDVSPDSQITVLRLDPLSDEVAADLLRSRGLGNSRAEEFIEEARDQGLGALLGNPLTLKLLADAVDLGNAWPKSRTDTFELACQKMAEEQNPEHLVGAGSVQTESVLDGAGYLSALYLLADVAGFSSVPIAELDPCVHLDRLSGPPAPLTRECLERALKTTMFTGGDGQCLSPLHRHVAEYLAGRHLAKLVTDGLPASRVVALMTSPSDGRVVTPLRGLSAWLAAHSPGARQLLIDADPVGVGLYGDIGIFSTGERESLLESLATFAAQGSLFGHEGRDGRVEGFGDNTASAFRSLASADMANSIGELISGLESGYQQDRIMEFILRVLSEADGPELPFLADLEPVLMAILRNPTWPPHVRESALKAYLRITPEGDAKADVLLGLLEEVHNRQISDPDDGLRGYLLRHLYPTWVPPSEVWRYVTPRNRPNYFGYFARFWRFDLLEQSSDRHIAELLGSFCENSSQLLAALERSRFEDLCFLLLDRGLETWGDGLDSSQLYDWLYAPRRSQRLRAVGEEAVQRIRTWLEARPQVQKSVFLTWIKRHESNERFEIYEYWNCNALHRSKPPADFGVWCLEKAVELVDAEPLAAQELLRQSYRSLDDPSISEGLTLEFLDGRTKEFDILADRFDQLCNPPPPVDEASEWKRELDDRLAEHGAEKRQQVADWQAHLRSIEVELRENRAAPRILDTLAKVYFALFINVEERALPQERISKFVGGDASLVVAVLEALRTAVFREDLPDVDRTISLHSESRHHYLAFPVLASMDLFQADGPPRLEALSDAQKRKALAIRYCVADTSRQQATSQCHDVWLHQSPDLVLDVLYECAVATLRAGEVYPSGLVDLDRVAGLDSRVHSIRIRLLRALSVRAHSKQHPLLDQLLGQALLHPDTAALSALVDKKLGAKSTTEAQRVRWLTVGALLSPEEHRQPLREFVGDDYDRTRHLAEFLRGASEDYRPGSSVMGQCSEPSLLQDVIEMLGRLYPPLMVNGFVTLEMDASDRIASLISLLGSMPGNEAQQALSILVDNPQLAAWHNLLRRTMECQRTLLGDASYVHPSIEQVQHTLSNGLPANAADLAALVREHLCKIAIKLRGDNSNLWRQFWNEDPHGYPTRSKSEESCRDAILTVLGVLLPSGVRAEPERNYAASKRADITVTCGDLNIPIELKKDDSNRLWSGLRDQLIDQYTTDPATDGHGIYVPLWFGREDRKPTPPSQGRRPTTAAELEKRLEQVLTADEARKISVLVLDVTKPGD
ncbi:NACHT domain-containing protein [Candidatus Poriferisocius sp.]|uniref:NACHT domain-containing protein n=1 Tax=Candidatus Poriferisocius sp. TaxID=3101276 RepID=UPI003B017EAF